MGNHIHLMVWAPASRPPSIFILPQCPSPTAPAESPFHLVCGPLPQVSKMTSATGPRRLMDVFPPGFDINSKSLSSRGHYHFAPEQLYHRLTDEYLPEKHIESTIVKSVWYGKQRKSARHEFILIEVEDLQAELKNYIVLDRNLNEAVAPTGKKIIPPKVASVSYSCRGAALDAFRVSYDGIEKRLLRECALWPRDYLEKIEFNSSEPFFLYQLATLVHVVSDKSPNYAMAYRNCYWFAGLIWECMRHLRPSAGYDDRLAANRGKFSILRYKPEVQERDAICDAFEKEMALVESRLVASRKLWSRMNGLNEGVEPTPPPEVSGPESQGPYKPNPPEKHLSYDENRHAMGMHCNNVKKRRSLWFGRRNSSFEL
ncbi:hypothetical protein RSOLAG22IIIB_07388 [Rhizoctonia solani]|uniref:Uncharacterized protein n=1 Tax=Rhizoctonia solani TaxID=456999 RepID=A0A0K6FMN9_9AGAM|nr:hypothetical protein RSOLAG22IIIB_07388 [Rhizoctonia solani]